MKNLSSFTEFEKNLINESGWSGENVDANFKLDGNKVKVTFPSNMKSDIKKMMNGKNDALLDLIEDEIEVQLGQEIDWDKDVITIDNGKGIEVVLENQVINEGKYDGKDLLNDLQEIVDQDRNTKITEPLSYKNFDRNYSFEFKHRNNEWEVYYDKLAKAAYLLDRESGNEQEIKSLDNFKKLLKSF